MVDTLSTQPIDDSDLILDPDEDRVNLSDSKIYDIAALLHDDDCDTVQNALADLNTVDTAELINKISDEDRRLLVRGYIDFIAPIVFTEIGPDIRKIMLEEMDPKQVASIISEVDSDDALGLILNLDPDFQAEVIKKLSSRIRLTLEEGLSFPEESAGRLMQREFVAIPEFWTVGKTVDYIRAASDTLPSDFFDIFVITPTYHIVGELPLNKLLRSKRTMKLDDIIERDNLHTIKATTDQEEVAELFRRDNLISAAVIDDEERLIGVITVDDVVDVIDAEAKEDLLRLAGVDNDDFYQAILSTSFSRFRWLFINLLTALLASAVISFFGATIEQIVALAVLMPIVASMGGNAGTQALSVAVRALATRELSEANAMRVIWKETLVGTMNGAAFAVLIGVIAGAWFQSLTLGLVIATAMIINLIVAGFAGAGIPIALQKMGSDPAVSSAVVLTTVTDVIGFFAFLGLAAIFLV